MSRSHESAEHETETEPLQSPQAAEDRATALVMILEPGDEARLADLLSRYPSQRDAIIAEATRWLGSEFVSAALDLAIAAELEYLNEPEAAEPEAEPAPEVAHEMASDLQITGVDEDGSLAIEIAHTAEDARHDVLEEVVETSPEAAVDMLEAAEEAPETEVEEAPSTAEVEQTAASAESDTERTSEPGWVTRARAYNHDHIDLVDEFNDLTGYICALDEDIVDPISVSRWQAQHGVPPDGRVGQQTVAAARAQGKVEPTPAETPLEIMPVGDLGLELE